MPISELAALSTQVLESIVTTVLQQGGKINSDLARAILFCSVPRWFDSEVVASMCPSTEIAGVSTDQILQHLCSLPFCERHPMREATWKFQEEIRTQFLMHDDVKQNWTRLQLRAAESFKRRLDGRELKAEERLRDADWKDLATEWVYHLLQVDPFAGLAAIRRIFARALAVWTDNGRLEVAFCSEFLGGLDWSEMPEQVKADITSMKDSLNALLIYNDADALKMFYDLAELPNLAPEQESALRYWIGSTHLHEEARLAKAREQLEAADKLAPNNALIHAEIAAVHYWPGTTWGRFDLARQHAQRAVELAPDKASGYVALGKIAELQENYTEAIAQYERAIEKEPQTYTGYLPLSETYSACGNLKQSLEMIAKASEVVTGINYFVLIRRGNAYRDARLYKEAFQEYTQAINESPGQIDAHLEWGGVQSILWNTPEAEKAYQKVIELKPEVPNGYVALARLYEQQEKWNQVFEICQRASKQGVEAKDIYILLSSLYGRKNELEKFQQEKERLVRFDPAQEVSVHCDIGDVWLNKARRCENGLEKEQWLKKAQSEYEKALAIDSYCAGVYFSIARLAVVRNDTEAVRRQQQLVEERTPWAKYEMLINLGRAYLDNFRYAESEAMLRAATDMAPQRTEGWRAWGELQNWLGNPVEVERAWATLVKINPVFLYEKHMRTGDAYLRVSNYAQARAEYSQAKELEPDMWEAYWYLADIDQAESKWDDAIANFSLVADKFSGLAAFAYVLEATIYKRQNKFPEAEKAARSALLLHHEKCDAYIELASLGVIQSREELVKESRQGSSALFTDKVYDFENAIGGEYRLAEEFGKAESVYRECINRDPQRIEAYLGLAQLRLKQEQYAEAEEWLAKARKIDCTNVSVYDVLSQIHEARQNLQGMIGAWQSVIELDPVRQYDACRSIGVQYEKLEQLDKAEEQFRRAVELSPWRADAYADLGSLLHKRGMIQEAETSYQRAKDIAGISFLDLGFYYEQQNKTEDAEAVYRQAIKTEPQSPDAYLLLAQMLKDGKKVEEAFEVYQQMAQQPELYDEALLAIGALQTEQGEIEKAEQTYRQAIKAAPKKPGAYVRLADMLVSAGKNRMEDAIAVCRQMAQQPELAYDGYLSIGNLSPDEKAVEAYKQAIAIDPKLPDAYLQLATLYDGQGKVAEAEQILQQAVEAASEYTAPYRSLAHLKERQGLWAEAIRLYRQVLNLETTGFTASDAHLRISNMLFAQKQVAEAEKEFLQALQCDPTNAEAYYFLGILYEQQGKAELALENFNKAIQLEPAEANAYLAYVACLRVYAIPKDIANLTQIAQRILSLNLEPDQKYEAHLQIANAYQTAQETEQAVTYFRLAIESAPQKPEAFIGLAHLLANENQWDKALEVCQQMARQPELNYEAQLLIGALHPKSEAAEQTYRQAINTNPGRPEAYVRLTELLVSKNRVEDARAVCLQMAQQPELAYDAYMSIGNLMDGIGKSDEAIETYRQAIAINPKLSDAYLQLAILHHQQGQITKTEQVLLQAMEIAPEDPKPHQFLAQLREQQERWDEAIALYRQAANLEPTKAAAADSYRSIGNLLIAQNHYVEAEQMLQLAVQGDPANGVTHYFLGMLYERQGETERALNSYLNTIDLAPKYGDAYSAIGRIYANRKDIKNLTLMAQRILRMELTTIEQYNAYLIIADAYQLAGLSEWAIDHLNKAVSLDPQRLDAYSSLGRIHVAQRHWAEARDMYKKVGELLPESQPDIHLSLGRLFMLEGDLENAEKELQQAGDSISVAEDARRESIIIDYLDLASEYRKQGNQVAMQAACGRILSLLQGSNSPDAKRQKGLAYLMQENYTQAAQTLEQAVTANSADHKARLYLAISRLAQGNQAEAQSDLKQATEQIIDSLEFDYAIEEAEVLAARKPELAGARELLLALREAKDKAAR